MGRWQLSLFGIIWETSTNGQGRYHKPVENYMALIIRKSNTPVMTVRVVQLQAPKIHIRDHWRGATWTNADVDARECEKLLRVRRGASSIHEERREKFGNSLRQEQVGSVLTTHHYASYLLKHVWTQYFPIHPPVYFFFPRDKTFQQGNGVTRWIQIDNIQDAIPFNAAGDAAGSNWRCVRLVSDVDIWLDGWQYFCERS